MQGGNGVQGCEVHEQFDAGCGAENQDAQGGEWREEEEASVHQEEAQGDAGPERTLHGCGQDQPPLQLLRPRGREVRRPAPPHQRQAPQHQGVLQLRDVWQRLHLPSRRGAAQANHPRGAQVLLRRGGLRLHCLLQGKGEPAQAEGA